MSQRYRTAAILLSLLLCFIGSGAHAQMAGSPAGSQGQGQWSISATGTFMNQQVGREIAHSQRWLLKSTYGIVPWLDFVATIGATDLRLDSRKKTIEKDYKDKHRFTFGLGLTLTLKKETEYKPLGIFAGGHFLRFPSKGMFTETAASGLIFYDYHMTYDCREYFIFGGLSYRIGHVRFYGCGAGWGISRLEKKVQYHYENRDAIQEDKVWDGEVNGEYQSPLWTGALAGVEVVFPKTGYFISLEGLFYNEKDHMIMVGIGQSGVLNEGW